EDVEIVRFNLLSALDIDEEIGSKEEDEDREIDEFTIKVLHNITDISSVLPLKKGKENKRDKYATKFFSGSKYPTLSLIYPIICELQNKFIDMSLELSNNDEDSNNEDDLENDDDTYLQAPSPPPDLDQIEN
ncbi:13458_t:CDS:2, partial [Racocetra fulgida]